MVGSGFGSAARSAAYAMLARRRWRSGSDKLLSRFATDRMSALRALADLPESQRECLLLVAWDGLLPREARPGKRRGRAGQSRA